MIGHAIYGADLDLSPTVTMGIVSKINRVSGIPVIIQVRFCNDVGLSPTVIMEIVSKIKDIVMTSHLLLPWRLCQRGTEFLGYQ